MKLAVELRSLVHESVALLGHVVKHQLGEKSFHRVELIRQQMTQLRRQSDQKSKHALDELSLRLLGLNAKERYEVAHSFTLMLELMNTAENAYRSYRLSQRQNQSHNQRSVKNRKEKKPASITYVLTAHPTEARAPKNIAIFHEIQKLLIGILENTEPGQKVVLTAPMKNDLVHLLEIAWRTQIVRQRAPKVKDEAEYIYSQVFRENVLFALMDANDGEVTFKLGSWVGGDKDGHPGVDEKTMIQSLTLSRNHLLNLVSQLLVDVRKTVELMGRSPLIKSISKLQAELKNSRVLKTNDIKKVRRTHVLFLKLQKEYQAQFGSLHPQLRRIDQIFILFPGR